MMEGPLISRSGKYGRVDGSFKPSHVDDTTVA